MCLSWTASLLGVDLDSAPCCVSAAVGSTPPPAGRRRGQASQDSPSSRNRLPDFAGSEGVKAARLGVGNGGWPAGRLTETACRCLSAPERRDLVSSPVFA